MLLPYIDLCCLGFVLFSLILWAFAGYAFRVNRNLPANDPKKRYFPAGALLLVPLTWPLLLLLWLFLLLVGALLYGLVLVLFSVALVALRRSFLLVWLDRLARYLGTKLLEANAYFIRLLFGEPRTPESV